MSLETEIMLWCYAGIVWMVATTGLLVYIALEMKDVKKQRYDDMCHLLARPTINPAWTLAEIMHRSYGSQLQEGWLDTILEWADYAKGKVDNDPEN